MNGAQATTPSTVTPGPYDAVCGIGRGDKLFAGSGDEANLHGSGVLVSTTQVLTAMHVMPYQSSGYHALPQDSSATARTVRFRRKLDGTAPVDGTCAGSLEVRVLGYRVPSPAAQIALLDLATPVAHIDPIPIDPDPPEVADELVMAGWGLDGATLFSGSRPNDVRLIEGREIASMVLGDGGIPLRFHWDGANPGPNLYDSGGPVLHLVDGDWYVAGIITTYAEAITLIRFEHDPTFRLPGLYSPDPGISAGAATAWLSSSDTYLRSSQPVQSFAATSPLLVSSSVGKANVANRALLPGFNVGGVGGELSAARLVFTMAADSILPLDAQVRLRRVRRNNAAVAATWVTYDGAAEWTTAGAGSTDSDVYTANQITVTVPAASVAGDEIVFEGAELLAMVEAARADDGTLRVLVEGLTNTTEVRFYSADYADPAVHPRLELTRVAAPAKSVPALGLGIGMRL